MSDTSLPGPGPAPAGAPARAEASPVAAPPAIDPLSGEPQGGWPKDVHLPDEGEDDAC